MGKMVHGWVIDMEDINIEQANGTKLYIKHVPIWENKDRYKYVEPNDIMNYLCQGIYDLTHDKPNVAVRLIEDLIIRLQEYNVHCEIEEGYWEREDNTKIDDHKETEYLFFTVVQDFLLDYFSKPLYKLLFNENSYVITTCEDDYENWNEWANGHNRYESGEALMFASMEV